MGVTGTQMLIAISNTKMNQRMLSYIASYQRFLEDVNTFQIPVGYSRKIIQNQPSKKNGYGTLYRKKKFPTQIYRNGIHEEE